MNHSDTHQSRLNDICKRKGPEEFVFLLAEEKGDTNREITKTIANDR
jgi:hypothetical protein